MTTKVIFRKFKDEGDIIALFPQELGDNDYYSTCLSYQHLGQHGSASIALMCDTVPAIEEEYRNLLDELKSIGYDDLLIAKVFNEDDFLSRQYKYRLIRGE